MKSLIVLAILGASSGAFAGALQITCEGKEVRMSVPSKGARPMRRELHLEVGGAEIVAQKVFEFEGSAAHDFQMIYQSVQPGTDVLAVLEYREGKIYLSTARHGAVIEEVACALGF